MCIDSLYLGVVVLGSGEFVDLLFQVCTEGVGAWVILSGRRGGESLHVS